MERNDIDNIAYLFKINFIIVYPQILGQNYDLLARYVLYVYCFYFHG